MAQTMSGLQSVEGFPQPAFRNPFLVGVFGDDGLESALHRCVHYIGFGIPLAQGVFSPRVLKEQPAISEARGSFTTALEGFLAAPFFGEVINDSEVGILLQECRIIDRIVARYSMPFAPKGERRNREIETLRNIIKGATARAGTLLLRLDDTLKKFGLLANV
jgi:hypothetical protein